LGKRPISTWFIDCADSIIQHRLATRMKLGQKRSKTGSPVDHTAVFIRSQADMIIANNGSLEELRWRIDDTLFAAITLQA